MGYLFLYPIYLLCDFLYFTYIEDNFATKQITTFATTLPQRFGFYAVIFKVKQ